MVEVHVAIVGLVNRNPVTGKIYNRTGAVHNVGTDIENNLSIKEALDMVTEHRILPDDDLPSSTNVPTIKEYLIAEATLDFRLVHMDQTFIITEKVT